MKPLPYKEAVALVDDVIRELPDQERTVIPKPSAMFDPETLAPQDIIALFLLKSGFDPEDLRRDHTLQVANTKHFWLTGYRAFYPETNRVFGGPHFKTQVFLSELIRKMDRGWAAGRAFEAAMRHADRMEERDRKILPHLADRW